MFIEAIACGTPVAVHGGAVAEVAAGGVTGPTTRRPRSTGPAPSARRHAGHSVRARSGSIRRWPERLPVAT